MKHIIKLGALILVAQVLLSCVKPDDLMTDGVKTGGLVEPSPMVAYLLNATPVCSVDVDIPKGPGISSIEVYKVFLRKADTTYSNKVLFKTIDVSSANATEPEHISYTFTYADLIQDITLEGNPLPADENLLELGDSWIFEYVSVMDGDDRLVVSNATTDIVISNRWTGSYYLSGYILRQGDDLLSGDYHNIPWKLATNGKKSVVYFKTHLWADNNPVGGIGPWVLNIDDSNGPDNPMPVTVTDPVNSAVQNNPAYDNRYDPATKTFYISVFWGNGPTHRAATDTLVYYGPY